MLTLQTKEELTNYKAIALFEQKEKKENKKSFTMNQLNVNEHMFDFIVDR